MRIPGLGWYAAAAAAALAGLAVAALIVWRFAAGLEEPARFLAPGSGSVEVAKPGRQVIWHEHRTVFEGRAFDLPEAMPDGARFQVTAPDGAALSVEAHGGSSSESGTTRRVSVARFEAAMPGRHQVRIEGSFPPRVIAVGPDFVGPLLKTVAGAIIALIVGIGAGIALGLYGFLQHSSALAGTTQAIAADREASLRQLVAVVYGLQAASLLVGITLIAGAIVDYLKRREAEGSWLESHIRWQIRTFWWSLFWCVLGLATVILLVGFPILFAAAVWLVYRVAKGWTSLNDGRPMYAENVTDRLHAQK